MVEGWRFIDGSGAFELPAPHRSSYLYFPLVNEAGMMSAVTPLLHGDTKAGQHAFLTAPVNVYDLHNSRSARNFWVHIAGIGPWSATGNSASQVASSFLGREEDEVSLRAGLLWHQIIRENKRLGIRAEITSFVPASDDMVELVSIRLTNTLEQPLKLLPTAAIPIYGRSADNLRDHRHVTSLLHRISCSETGVLVRPTLSFDERGHHLNQTVYVVLGTEADGTPPEGFFPLVDDFVGEGGCLDWPQAALGARIDWVSAGTTCEGNEAMGGLRFREINLTPGQSCSYILMLGILGDGRDASSLVGTYGSQEKFDAWLAETERYWQAKHQGLAFQTNDAQLDQWLKWVGIQPTLRRLFGNSFLPYHDYGRGGRGWRDLWQDILALIVMETGPVDHLLIGNFAGVRLDGSNATIIGNNPGEFRADRNNIPRVWMDHGAWPLLTTRLYIDWTGDLSFLLRHQVYFRDHLTERGTKVNADWEPSQGTRQLTSTGATCHGTVLEHLLVQHLTAFFNVGEHNHIRLEGADWNDGLDMAAQRGESVAFTALYASNLRQIGELVEGLRQSGSEYLYLNTEILLLLDTLTAKIDYSSVGAKQQRLREYLAAVSHAVTGSTVPVRPVDLVADLTAKADWIYEHIRATEWIPGREGHGWFNGYYDNDGRRLEGDSADGVRMTLTGQVFTLMSGIATDEQAGELVHSVDRYLFDARVGGCRLNTDFQEVLLSMGRSFGFAFGHKENGAVFSHMAVMYAYALYERGYARQAYRVMDQIYQQSVKFEASRMYPGIPEYFTPRGRGAYPYLTGAASWYLLTLLTQAYGVRGNLGDLVLSPRLVREQFDAEGNAGVLTRFADRQIRVVYRNPGLLDHGEYKVGSVRVSECEIPAEVSASGWRVPRQHLSALMPDRVHRISALLVPG